MYDLVSAPTTKFLGNSLEVYPYGKHSRHTHTHHSTLWSPATHSAAQRSLLQYP